MSGIRIDELPVSLAPTLDHLFPAMRGGVTEVLTVQQVATLILAIVTDSAPEALDTLNELAAALGDDPNFAATMATAISNLNSGKAPLDSPQLTGNPTAPTQAAGNNTTRIANTSFVTTAITDAINGIKNGVAAAFDTFAEVAAALGKRVAVDADQTFSTPEKARARANIAAVGLEGDDNVGGVKKFTSGFIQIGADAGTKVRLNFQGQISGDGGDFYHTLWSNMSVVQSAFNSSSAGYVQLPNGLMLQWGYYGGGGDTTISFPIAFPTFCRSVQLTPLWDSVSVELHAAFLSVVTRTGFTMRPRFASGGTVGMATQPYLWLAIGH